MLKFNKLEARKRYQLYANILHFFLYITLNIVILPQIKISMMEKKRDDAISFMHTFGIISARLKHSFVAFYTTSNVALSINNTH